MNLKIKNLEVKVMEKKELKEKSDLIEEMKNSAPLYWVGTMNAIKGQVEEIVYNEIIYK